MHTSRASRGTARHAPPSDDGAYGPREDPRSPSPGADEGSGRKSLAPEAAAQDVSRLEREIEGLRRRLLTQPTIEQAKGLLIGFYGIDPEAAFAILVRWSQHTNIKLHRLAVKLVDAASESSGQPGTGLHRFIDQLPNPDLTPLPGRSR